LRPTIDPRQVPNITNILQADQALWDDEQFATCSSQQPIPFAVSNYLSVDQGSSAEQYK
jgi:hypothetical protein